MGFAELLAVADQQVRARTGETLVYTSGLGVSATLSGVFDLSHRVVDLGQSGVDGYAPAAFFALADLTSDPELDEQATVTARGVTYSVHEVRKSAGGVLLLLHRA
jgi:hypothetical protein